MEEKKRSKIQRKKDRDDRRANIRNSIAESLKISDDLSSTDLTDEGSSSEDPFVAPNMGPLNTTKNRRQRLPPQQRLKSEGSNSGRSRLRSSIDFALGPLKSLKLEGSNSGRSGLRRSIGLSLDSEGSNSGRSSLRRSLSLDPPRQRIKKEASNSSRTSSVRRSIKASMEDEQDSGSKSNNIKESAPSSSSSTSSSSSSKRKKKTKSSRKGTSTSLKVVAPFLEPNPRSPRSSSKKTASRSRTGKKTNGKRVSFSRITIYEHPIILGDHPAVSEGAPIAIGWKSQGSMVFGIDYYEKYFLAERFLKRQEMEYRRAKRGGNATSTSTHKNGRKRGLRRKRKELVLSGPERFRILLHAGFLPEDIFDASIRVQEIQEGRLETIRALQSRMNLLEGPFNMLLDGFRDGFRMLKIPFSIITSYEKS